MHNLCTLVANSMVAFGCKALYQKHLNGGYKQKNARRPSPGVFFGEELVREVKRGWRTRQVGAGAGDQRVPRQGPTLLRDAPQGALAVGARSWIQPASGCCHPLCSPAERGPAGDLRALF